MANATTPENLIARYLTVGGATVDVIATKYVDVDPNHRADCNGCGKYEETAEAHTEARYERYVRETTEKIRQWAQAHAEYCRAMSMETTND